MHVVLLVGNNNPTMLWKTRRSLQQDIRGITCLPNPSHTADNFPSSDHPSWDGARTLKFPSRFYTVMRSAW